MNAGGSLDGRFMSPERIERGIARLLAAPKDVAQPVSSGPPGNSRVFASAEHRASFTEYAEQLGYVIPAALEWWQRGVTARRAAAETDALALRDAWLARPAGPASFPPLVALVRDFWLACHAINGRVTERERVPPEEFLLTWPREAGHDDAVAVLACMPYWPIGMDESGQWA